MLKEFERICFGDTFETYKRKSQEAINKSTYIDFFLCPQIHFHDQSTKRHKTNFIPTTNNEQLQLRPCE